jgi:hypothetical protein
MYPSRAPSRNDVLRTKCNSPKWMHTVCGVTPQNHCLWLSKYIEERSVWSAGERQRIKFWIEVKRHGVRRRSKGRGNGGRRTRFQYPGGDTHLAVSWGLLRLLPSPQPWERELPTNRCLETYSTTPYCIAKVVLDIRVQASNTVRTEIILPVIGTGCCLRPPRSRRETLKLGTILPRHTFRWNPSQDFVFLQQD